MNSPPSTYYGDTPHNDSRAQSSMRPGTVGLRAYHLTEGFLDGPNGDVSQLTQTLESSGWSDFLTSSFHDELHPLTASFDQEE